MAAADDNKHLTINNFDYLFNPSIKINYKEKVFLVKCEDCRLAKKIENPEMIYCEKYNMYSYKNQACKSGEKGNEKTM